MRISLVTDTWLPEVNGVTTVLSAMRAGLRQRGHAVQVVAPRYPTPAGDESEVVRIASTPLPGYAQSRLAFPLPGQVARALDGFGPDVVHVITEGLVGAAGRRYAVSRGLTLVTS